MYRDELKASLEELEKKITAIKQEQLEIIASYVKEKHRLEVDDIVKYKGYTYVITGFEYNSPANNLKVSIRKIIYTGKLDSNTYTTSINSQLKPTGEKYKYYGK